MPDSEPFMRRRGGYIDTQRPSRAGYLTLIAVFCLIWAGVLFALLLLTP